MSVSGLQKDGFYRSGPGTQGLDIVVYPRVSLPLSDPYHLHTDLCRERTNANRIVSVTIALSPLNQYGSRWLLKWQEKSHRTLTYESGWCQNRLSFGQTDSQRMNTDLLKNPLLSSYLPTPLQLYLTIYYSKVIQWHSKVEEIFQCSGKSYHGMGQH